MLGIRLLFSISAFSLTIVPSIILVDPFCTYLSGEMRSICEKSGIKVFDAVSPYVARIIEGDSATDEGRSLPRSMRIPDSLDDILIWLQELESFFTDDDNCDSNCQDINYKYRIDCVLSESDSGLLATEMIETALKFKTKTKSNGNSKHFRSKYLLNEMLSQYDMVTSKQALVKTPNDINIFLDKLWGVGKHEGKCILKPQRGVGSEDVYLLHSRHDVLMTFNNLFKTSRYGGGINNDLLLQEYIEGQEYAIDTVSCDGDVKVVAIWKYHKVTTNDAPFVYQSTELVTDIDTCALKAAEYAVKALKVCGHRWGPTHTEVKVRRVNCEGEGQQEDSYEPIMIEVNTRWHAHPVSKLCRKVYGWHRDAIQDTYKAYFDHHAFHKLPSMPQFTTPRGYARAVHLINRIEGMIYYIYAMI